MASRSVRKAGNFEEFVRHLSADELRAIVVSAAARHDDIERHVRLVAARAGGDLTELRAEVDRGLRTRRFLGYRESGEWAQDARPVLEELRLASELAPTQELIMLIQRAIGHVVKVIMHADDSDGAIGGLARELLELLAEACDAGGADPVKLAKWMVRFSCDDQDFFETDPVRYAGALGDRGLATYRKAISERSDGEQFAVRWARERLAVLDGDQKAIILMLGGDLSAPHQFGRVCEAMDELKLDDQVLHWAQRGIAETDGWQVAKLYDFASGVFEKRSDPVAVLRLRREQHGRMASANTYSMLRKAANELDAWEIEREAAREALRIRDRGQLVDALLDEGDVDVAWRVAHEDVKWVPSSERRLALAKACEHDRPERALHSYMLAIDEILLKTGRGSYRNAVAVLKRARTA
ncbi:MAG: hypothetical protein WAP35_06310, partial [Solirubrobacterales bacterium]